MSTREELRSSEILLDMGVSLPLRPLRLFGGRAGRITMRRPPLGLLVAMSRYYLRMGVRAEELKGYTTEQWAAFIARHGRDCAAMVACTLCGGWLGYRLLHPILTRYLLWRVHPAVLGDAMLLLLESLDTGPFVITISSAQAMSPMRPRLSQEKKGS